MSTVKVKFRKHYNTERLRPFNEGFDEPYLRVIGNSGQVPEETFKTYGLHNQAQIDLISKNKKGSATKTFILIKYPDNTQKGYMFEQFFYPETIKEKAKQLGGKPSIFFYVEAEHNGKKFINHISVVFFFKGNNIWESFDMDALYYHNEKTNEKVVTLETFVYKEDESKIIEGKERLRGKFVGECV
jgi:hypothetical protein